MPKISDAYVQFSARGLKELTKEIENAGSNVNKLKNVGKSSRGFFSESIVKDIGNLKRLIDQFDKVKGASAKAMADLRRVKAQTQATAIESSFAADRARTSKSAKLAARERIASISTRATAASPIAIEAEKLARNQRNKEARNNRDALAARIAADATTSASFKARASAVSGIAVTAGMSPDDLRKQADDLRTLSASLSRFSRGGAKSARDDMRSLADEIEAAADAAERLVAIEKLAKGLSPERKGQIRGQVLDELGAESRAEAISGRQAGRDIRSESPRRRAGRRIDEIDERTDLTDPQANQEISIAANEVADAMRKLASEIRESPIDEALAEAARKLKSGSISEDDFLAQETSSRFKRAGSERAEGTIDSIRLKAKTGNSGRATDTKAEIDALTARRDELAASSKNLNAAELKLNETERSLLGTEIKLKTAQLGLIKELDNHEEHVKKLLTTKAELDSKVASGVKLSKAEERARKENSNEIEVAARKEKELNSALTGTNGRLHDAAGASRNWNFKLQQLSYGVQDFVQVIGQTGLSGALRASANNMASFFAASGTPGGAIFGAVGTIAMIGIADAISAMGNEAESSEGKLEKLAKQLERIQSIRVRSSNFSGETAGVTSIDNIDVDAFASRSTAFEENRLKYRESTDAAAGTARAAITDLSGSPEITEDFAQNMRNLWGGIESAYTFSVGEFNRKKIAILKTNARGEGANAADSEAAALAQLDKEKEELLTRAEDIKYLFGDAVGDQANEEFEKRKEEIGREYQRIKANIVEVNASTDEGMIAIATELGVSAEELEKHKQDLAAIETERLMIIKESEDALALAISQISDYLGRQVRQIGRGDFSGLSSASDNIAGQYRSSVSRQKKNQSQADNALLSPEQREDAQRRIGQEEKLQESLKDSMRDLAAAVRNAPAMGQDGLRTMAEESRIRLGTVSSRSFDQVSSESQGIAEEHENVRLKSQRQLDIFNDQNSTVDEKAQALIESQRLSSIGQALEASFRALDAAARNMALTFGNTDRLIGSQASRDATANRFGSFQTSQQQIDPFVSQIEDAQVRLRAAQRKKRDSVDVASKLVADTVIDRETRLIAELTSSVNDLTGAANDIPSSLSGISGSISAELMNNASRKLRSEEAIGGNANFNRQNTQASVSSIGDAVLGFSGKVERRLGETQEAANDREKERLQKMIDELQGDADADNDALIPFLEMAQRKIGTDEESKRKAGVPTQENTGVTPIEGLHQKIQESLKKDNVEFDLQKKNQDLLAQIAANTAKNIELGKDVLAPAGSPFASLDPAKPEGLFGSVPDTLFAGLGEGIGLESNVETGQTGESSVAANDAVQYAKTSADRLGEIFKLLKDRKDNPGLMIG